MDFIFVKHKFVEDFVNATGTGDNFLKQEMIIDQVAKLIFEHKSKVIKALRDNGIASSTDSSNQKVADLIIKNVEYNDGLVKELRNLIIKYNITEKEFYKSLNPGINELLKNESFRKELIEEIDQKIKNIGVKKQPYDRGISNGEALKERIRLAEMKNSMLRVDGIRTKRILTNVAISIGVAVVIAGIAYFVWKETKNNKLQNNSMGGTVGVAGSGGTAPVIPVATSTPATPIANAPVPAN
jgi:hypothetical protein